MEVDDDLQTLLIEQRRELAAAISSKSDHDLAFNLQMEEAFNASLASQPSSSASKRQRFDVPDDAGFISAILAEEEEIARLLAEDEEIDKFVRERSDREHVDAEMRRVREELDRRIHDDVPDDAGFVSAILAEEDEIARLLAEDEEIDKFERERSDREHVDAEMRRVREELGRRIHDRAFARDVLTVPEAEWKNEGDCFNKPYKRVLGNEKITSENFRLYCKGLVRQDRDENGKMKVLAGIGVVICDSSGEIVVFKVRKPLVLREISVEIAEVKALIEGLNAALALGLERITVFCEDNATYQYFTGKGVTKLGNMETLVDELTQLQRKFTRCHPRLVEKKNVHFAFGLASDAILAQVTWPAESSGHIKFTEACIICLEDRAVGQMLVVDGCKHRYCSTCLKQHAEAKLFQGTLPRCPHEGCKFELKFEFCRKFLTREVLDMMSQRIKEATIPVAEKVYCPYPRCSSLMSRTEVCAINNAEGSMCTKCHGLFCIYCKVPWHSNMSCSQYKKLHPYLCSEEVKLKSLATKKQWRQCKKCNNMIELKSGCHHISCRCGHQFCYTCGAEWKNKKATCRCALWDERNIVYSAGSRR